MDTLIFSAVVLLVLIGALAYAYHRLKRYIGWHQFRSEYGMSYTGFGVLMDFGIEGTYHGHPVQIWLERERGLLEQGLGQSKDEFADDRERRWTYYQMVLPEAVPGDLAVYEEGMLSDAAETVGAQDIEIGREIFDEYLTVKANDAEAARKYLSRPEVADAFLEFRNAFKNGFEVENGVARVHHRGMAHVEPNLDEDDSEVQAQGQLEAAFDGVSTMQTYRLENQLERMADCVDELEELGRTGGGDEEPDRAEASP